MNNVEVGQKFKRVGSWVTGFALEDIMTVTSVSPEGRVEYVYDYGKDAHDRVGSFFPDESTFVSTGKRNGFVPFEGEVEEVMKVEEGQRFRRIGEWTKYGGNFEDDNVITITALNFGNVNYVYDSGHYDYSPYEAFFEDEEAYRVSNRLSGFVLLEEVDPAVVEGVITGERVGNGGVEFDVVDKAPHYNTGKYEVIDVAEDWGLDKDAYLFNVLKYIARAGKKSKDKLLEDLKKARYYLDRRIKMLEDGSE